MTSLLQRLRVFQIRLAPFALWGLLLSGCASAPATTLTPSEALRSDLSLASLQAEAAAVAREQIRPEEMQRIVEFLASDELLGRDTPSIGLERAADFLVAEFQALGLVPAGGDGSFLQRWPYRRLVRDAERTRAGFSFAGASEDWAYGRDFFAFPGSPQASSGTPVYAPTPGLALTGLPVEARGNPLVVGLPDGFGPDIILAVQAAMGAGSSSLILIMDEETGAGDIFQIASALEGGAAGQLPLPTLGLRRDLGAQLLAVGGAAVDSGEARVLDGIHVELQLSFEEEEVWVPNVVALLPGSDPLLRETTVILSAHFDHVGVGPVDERGDSIYNGADDNASGTAALLGMAAAFAALPEPPARSILFLAVSGEEKGLLGSEWYAGNPTVSLEGMVANVNLDMVGRNHPDSIVVIGPEFSDLGDRIEAVARAHPDLGLILGEDPDPEEQVFLRSDHFSFVQRGVPALFLTTWLHDDYHSPSDRAEWIDTDKLTRVARLGFLLAHQIANDPTPPRWTPAGQELLRSLSP